MYKKMGHVISCLFSYLFKYFIIIGLEDSQHSDADTYWATGMHILGPKSIFSISVTTLVKISRLLQPTPLPFDYNTKSSFKISLEGEK